MSSRTSSLIEPSREQVARLLGGVPVITAMRLEQVGRLIAVRLTKSATAKVFYVASQQGRA
jgi:hypothetical protein